ncbi:TIGR00341 family protein [Halobellus sp. GM3]|uniref:TIGR00341 family protein n=1 Tax=Halobellus sp. GM3 TaxID=3458410 RepID=UPI00403D8843
MRLIQIAVPRGQRDVVIDVLREEQFGYTVLDGASAQDGSAVITFVAPADAVEHVLEDLEAAGVDRSTFTVSVEAEFADYDHVEEVQNRWAKSPNRLAPRALRSKAKDMRLNTRSYLWMMVLSAIVATAGLLASSPAVVVGAMVIAPIVSPAITASVGAVRDDREMVVDSVHMQALGLGTAIGTATAVGWLARALHVVPATLAVDQLALVALRLSPGMVPLTVAVAAGAAGAYGLATKGQTTIVGVMIAAALIPTASAVGIGVAWGNSLLAVGALFLLLLSLIGVNVGGAAILYYLDYRPDEVDDGVLTRASSKQAVVALVTVLFVIATVGVVGVAFVQQSAFERTVNDATTDVLSRGLYEGLDVRATTVEYASPGLSERATISLTLVRSADRSYPALPQELDATITERTDRPVTVQVQFVDYHRSDSEPTNALSG